MRAPLRLTVDIIAAAGVIAVALLGAWWASDRVQRWERPRWSRESFEPLRVTPPVGRPSSGLRVVATNPRCSRCITTVWRLYDARARQGWPEELVVLIVDTPARPDPRALRRLPPIPVWWDRENRWRRRWGHRLYGELLQFDATGRYLRTIVADALPRLRGPRASRASTAPALERRGGT